MVVSVRPRRATKRRCGRCGARSGRYDNGEGRRRWRALDLGVVKAYVEAEAPRVRCRDHGVVVAQVPWARHGAGHTRAFDDQVAWLVTHCSKTAVTELMRVAWRTVGTIVGRVVADAREAADPFDGLRRIGIDEISHKRGHRYLTVVVDHDSGRLIWAAPGRDKATLEASFVVRRETWNTARRVGLAGRAKQLKGCRYALWKNPENLTGRQAGKLAWIARHNNRLYRAYLLKEQFRLVFQHRGAEAIAMLDAWLSWARRCRIPAFVDLARRVVKHRAAIEATLTHGLSNALVESTNTKLRLLTRLAYGFRSTDNLIALCLLDRGGYCPPLPGSQTG
ncbi:MAG: ISL3 family transposase [Acidimicrobiia bacterium]|nr:ISL3 family transposase [Acidimicrobiia bacterium]